MPDPPTTTSKSAATVVISPMDSQFWALTCRDTLRLILQKLPVPDLARAICVCRLWASCVCRLWNSVASDHELITIAFKAPWKLKHVVGKPVSGSFWRDSGIGKFAISHRLASLAVKYTVQLDTYAKREVAVLYLEGGPERKSSHLLKKMSTEEGKRKVVDSLKRSMQVDDGTAQYYLSISNGDPWAALSEFFEDLRWERRGLGIVSGMMSSSVTWDLGSA